MNSPASSRRSPFSVPHAHQNATAQGSKEVGVRLTAQTLPSVTLISTWTSGLQGLMQSLGQLFGSAVPQQTGHTCTTDMGLLARTGPEEFMLIGEQVAPGRVAQLRATIAADVGAVVDLSHARCRIGIQGPHTRRALSKLFALDLRTRAFPVGQVQLSGTHHVPSLLYRTQEDAFDWIVFTSYAQDQLETLADAALEYGVAITVEA